MVRSRLRRNPGAPFFRFPHEPYGTLGGNMAYVKRGAREFAENYVPDHPDLLRSAGNSPKAKFGRDETLVHDAARRKPDVFGVRDYGNTERLYVLHGLSHEPRVGDRHSVVGNRHAPGFAHLPYVGKLLSLLPLGYRPYGKHVDYSLGSRLKEYVLRHRGVVVYGIRVGHAHYGGETARGGREAACPYRLLVLIARFSEVHVNIHESRGHDLPACVYHGV